jgi:hypothetical protein
LTYNVEGSSTANDEYYKDEHKPRNSIEDEENDVNKWGYVINHFQEIQQFENNHNRQYRFKHSQILNG